MPRPEPGGGFCMFSARLIQLLDRLRESGAAQRLGGRIAAPGADAPTRPRFGRAASAETLERFWADHPHNLREALADAAVLAGASEYTANIENMIGLARIPI